jgi:capsular polysaccharide biosynthesis protein
MTSFALRALSEWSGVKPVAVLAPAQAYDRPAPTRVHATTAAAQAHARYFSQQAARWPEQRLHALGDVLVMGTGILLQGGSMLKENAEAAPVERILERLNKKPPVPERVIREPVLYLMRYGLNNYGHALTDIVPRLFWAAQAHPELMLALSPDFVPTAIEALFDLGLDPERLLQLEPAPTRLLQGHFADPCSRHPLLHSPAALALLRQASTPAKGSAERLFVTRADAKTRHLRNHRELARALAALGFEEVATGRMSHAEQVALFRGAREVVGIAGASMTNILYCQPGTRVTVLAPDTMPSLYFWDIAAQLGLDFRVGYFPAHRVQDGTHSDFSPEPAAVLALIGD